MCAGVPFSSQATSISFPIFSTPVFQTNRLFVTSPDSTRLICVGTNGTKFWEKSFAQPVSLSSGRNSEPLLQIERDVRLVSPTGELVPKFTVEDANDKVSFREDCELFISHDRRFNKRRFTVIDDRTGKRLWTSLAVESLICATSNLLVTLTFDRIPTDRGYTFGNGALEAFDRVHYARKWSIPISEKDVLPYLEAVLNGPYLIYADGRTSLKTIEVASGREVTAQSVKVPQFSWVGDIQSYRDEIVWLTHESNRADFNQSEHTLHFCSIPELSEKRTVTLKIISISNFAFEDDFIISDSLYRLACFRMGGEKVWEKRSQSNQTKVIGNRIYFSDYDQAKARLGYVEVSTGKEKILYSEPTK